MRHILIGGNGFVGRETVRLIVEDSDDGIIVVDLPESFKKYPRKADPRIEYLEADVSNAGALNSIKLAADDVIHHLATRLIIPNEPRFGRDEYFRVCAVDGTTEILTWMKNQKNSNLVFWSTDMVYGPAMETPRTEKHPKHPFGPYGRSKVAAEEIIAAAVARGDVTCTVFRPRLILGAGRLGILEVLFKALDRGSPIPLIGPGLNKFQFVPVTDCARATLLAAKKGCPNGIYNLGTDNSPIVYDLMRDFLKETGSKSRLIRTPAWLVKATLRFLNLFKIAPMDPEQYEIADLDVELDTSAVKRDLGWVPTQTDEELLFAAYDSYSAK
jgi:dTDP-glucose 4,6-dehydratase